MIRVKRARKALASVKPVTTPIDQDANFLAEIVMQARQLANNYKEGESKLDSDISAIMELAMELHDKFISNGIIDDLLKNALEQEKIRITKNTTSVFVPLMKLVAPGLTSSTRGRSAAILSYADANGVKAKNVGDFVRGNGGIVKCLKAANEMKRPDRAQKRAERVDAKLVALRENAKTFSAPVLRDGLADGLWCCLIEREGSRLSILSYKPSSPGGGFRPLGDDEFLDFG